MAPKLSPFLCFLPFSAASVCTVYTGNANGASGSGLAELQQPYDTFLDSSDDLYIADVNNNRILKIPEATGTPELAVSATAPYGVIIDGSGNIIITHSESAEVTSGQPGGARSIIAGGNGKANAANQLNGNNGIALDPNGDLLIAEAGAHRVSKWVPGASSGTALFTAAGFDEPMKVRVNAAGEIFVADYQNDRVLKFEAGTTTGSGTVVAGSGGRGTGTTQLYAPWDVAEDSAGNLLVAERKSHRVSLWKVGATEKEVIAGGNGDGTGLDQLNNPTGVRLDSRNEFFYIADKNNHRVMKCVYPLGPTATSSTASTSSSSTGSSTTTMTRSSSSTASSSSVTLTTTSETITMTTSTTVSTTTTSVSSTSTLSSTSSSSSSTSSLTTTSISSSSTTTSSFTSTGTTTSSSSSSSSGTTSSSSTSATSTTSGTETPTSTSSGTSSSSLTSSSTLSSTSFTAGLSTTFTSPLTSTPSTSSTVSSSTSASPSASSSASSTALTSGWRSTSEGTTSEEKGITTPQAEPESLQDAVLAATEPCLMLSAVFDVEGPLSLVAGVELFARCAVWDSSEYSLRASDGTHAFLPRGSLSQGEYYYAASQSRPGGFAAFFGFPPNLDTMLLLRGRTAVDLLFQGRVVDVYGDRNVNGGGSPWEYTDGYAHRLSGFPIGKFVLNNWHVSGLDAVQGFTTNQNGASLVIPVGSFKSNTAFVASAAEMQVMAASLAGTSFLKNRNMPNATVETAAGTQSFYDLQAVPEESHSRRVALAAAGTRVSFPKALLGALKAQKAFLSALATKGTSLASFRELLGPNGEELASQVLDVSVYDADGRYLPLRLDEPLLLKLPEQVTGSAAPPGDFEEECVFLDTKDGRPFWSSEGVRRATEQEVRDAGEDPAGVWCFTMHLSIFAAIWKAVLGCTNVEIFTEDAFRAFSENGDWYESRPMGIVFFLLTLSLLLFVVGNAWESWAFRLGQTYAPGKTVHLCDKIMQANIKHIKHKYMGIVVYFRDLAMHLRTGQQKLRKTSLMSGVQRFLGLRYGISVACVSQHCWNGGGWIDTGAALPKTTLCRKLEFHAGGAEEVMQRDMVGTSFVKIAKRFLMTFLALHPLLDSMRVGAGAMTAAKRTTLQVAGLFGALASNAMIFNFSGETKSWEAEAECPIEPTSQLFIIVATLISILINVIPNGFLMDVGRQVHGRPLWNLFFWVVATIYLSTSGLTVFLALANLNARDQGKWYKSLEWVCLMKFLVLPLAQALRHSLLLEGFLHEDTKLPPSKQFPVWMGLRHSNEAKLSPAEQKEAEQMALEAISAEELVKFTAMLGDKIMLAYDPETSTSDEVMRQAIAPLCSPPPSLQDYALFAEVVGASHLPPAASEDERLSCSILHLGQQRSQCRACISERAGPCAARSGQSQSCVWSFCATVSDLQPDHALAFAVKSGNDILGLACLTAEEVFQEHDQTLTLSLHPPEMQQESVEGASYVVPSMSVGQPSYKELTGSGGQAIQPATILVKIRLPSGFLEVLARNELWKLKKERPMTDSDVLDPGAELQSKLFRRHDREGVPSPVTTPSAASAGKSTGSVRCGAFCQNYMHDFQPPDKFIVHCSQGRFLHLVCAVLTDALHGRASYKEVEEKILKKDFHGLLESLTQAKSLETRYWIEIFAVDPRDFEKVRGHSHWHEDLLPNLPTIVRRMRHLSCHNMVDEIKAGREPKRGPLEQLLLLDRSCGLMRERTCLAEMMLAKALCVKQRFVLEPELLREQTLSTEIRGLASKLGDEGSGLEVPWTLPFLSDTQAVYDRVRELVLAAVKAQRDDSEATLRELNLSDIAITVGAAELIRPSAIRDADQGPVVGEDDDGDFGGGDGDFGGDN